MPDRLKSTLPPVPPVTAEEKEAQAALRHLADLVWFIEWFLDAVHARLPDPSNAEAMGNGAIPETLAFSLRGSMECALHDHVNPLYSLLKDAIEETPEKLVRDWQKRKREGR